MTQETNGGNGKEFQEVVVPAVEGRVNAEADRIKVYTAEVPANVVGTFSVERALAAQEGFQRPLDKTRAGKIAQLMGGNRAKHIDPVPNLHGGLLAYGTPEQVEFIPAKVRNQEQTYGELHIKAPLNFIDGQHRGAGAGIAVQTGYVDREHPFTESVRVVIGATRQELAMWYLRTNLEMRKVPPANIILDVANMTGTVMRRKTWIARIAVGLTSEEPFKAGDLPLVSFSLGDGGVITMQTLYRTVDLLLPIELNRESPEIEKEAIVYAQKSFAAYAEVFGDAWGRLDDEGRFEKSDIYSFTMFLAWVRLYSSLHEPGKTQDEVSEAAQTAFREAGLDSGILPTGMGTGEKAAQALAAYAAGRAGLAVERLSETGAR